MSANPKHIPISEAPTYTVSNLLAKLSMTSQNEIFKSIDALIRVQGQVTKIYKKYPNVVYFEFMHGQERMSVKCSRKEAISEGEYLIIEGFPVIKPATYHSGLDVNIDGKCVGNWVPRKETTEEFELHKSAHTRLQDFLNQHDLSDLYLMGSETAVKDVLSSVDEEIKHKIRHEYIVVGNKDTLIKSINNVFKKRQFSALMIVRGGDDATMNIWDDPELIKTILDFDTTFYLALGHSHKLTFAAHYADESFHTPSALGKSIQSIWYNKLKQQKLQKDLNALQHQNSEIDKQLTIKENDHAYLTHQLKKKTLLIWLSTLSSVSIITVLLLILFKVIDLPF